MARPTISLQAAIGPGSALTNPFIIGSSLIGGTDVIVGREVYGQGGWVELSSTNDRVYSVSTRRGRQRQLEQFRAGTLTAELDNADGALDPAWANGPYTDGAGTTRIKPMAGVQLVANYAGVDYPIIFVYADAWKPSLSYPEGGTVTLSGTDAFKIFTKTDPLEQTPVGAGESTGARINRILELANWSASLRDIDTGDATHQATNLAQTIAAQLRLAADSERGDLYIGADGKVVLRGWLSRYTSPRSTTVQWQIGDTAGKLQPSSFEPSNDDDVIVNDVNVSRAGGSIVTASDPTLIDFPYLWSSYNRTDLTLADDVQVSRYASRVLTASKTLQYRVSSVTFEPDGYEDLWPFILGAKFGDRCTVSLTHPRTGVVFSGDYFIEGIDHDITPAENTGRWVTKFSLSDASKYPTNPFIIGQSLIGGTDVII